MFFVEFKEFDESDLSALIVNSECLRNDSFE